MSTIRVKVSKVMANKIAEFIKTKTKDEHEVRVTTRSHSWYVMNMPTDAWLDERDLDYNTCEFKVISIYRPYEYYAPAVHISTAMLVDSLNRISKVANKTLDDLLEQVWTDYIEC